jgi:hypothetical protein
MLFSVLPREPERSREIPDRDFWGGIPPLWRVRILMHKGRLEAFSDGVLAIIITIMVLEMKLPLPHQGAGLLLKI